VDVIDARRVAAFFNYIRREGSNRPGRVWTIVVEPLTTAWFLRGDGEKRPRQTRLALAIGGSSRIRPETERRGSAEITASCGVSDGERR
jgi:hypothetical protein